MFKSLRMKMFKFLCKLFGHKYDMNEIHDLNDLPEEMRGDKTFLHPFPVPGHLTLHLSLGICKRCGVRQVFASVTNDTIQPIDYAVVTIPYIDESEG